MAQDRGSLDTLAVQEINEVAGHQRIAHLRAVEGAAMVSLVNGQDLEMGGQFAGHRVPIVERAKQPVEDHEWGALADGLEVK
jgi:hypothetical protein